jgi:PTS system nitrogen regulatory IIA component
LTSIADHLDPADVLLDLDVADKPQLFAAIGRHMERAHGLTRDWVCNGLDRREQAGSTGLGAGVAIPHARVKDLDRIRVAYVRLQTPMPYDAPDKVAVSHVLVLLVPKQATEEHLRLLAEAAELLSDPQFRDSLLACADAMQVKERFDTWLRKGC